MKIDSSVELKKVHAKEIINYLRKNSNSMKKTMAADLSLSFATVSNICNEMRELGYLEESILDDEKVVGRTPKGISLCGRNLLSLCFNLTKEGLIKAAVLDISANIIYEKVFPYPSQDGIEILVKTCKTAYEEIILREFEAEQIIGIGVAIPGIFEKSTQNVVSSEIEMFNNQPLKVMIAKALNKPVYVDNESNLCVMSKQVTGDDGQGWSDAIYIFADEGLGIGVSTNGELIRGSNGYAPEICHMPIGNMQLKCHLCGGAGCVESDLSKVGYLDKYNLYAIQKIQRYLEFVQLAQSGDDIAGKVMEENAEILGKLLSILNNIFNPGCIYIGGETVTLLEKKMEQIMWEVKSRLLVQGNILPEVKLDQDSDITVLKGASEMVFFQWVPQV